MEIPQITPQDAHDRMQVENGGIYVDVRSSPEFERGHPDGALNIPIMHFDPTQGGMVENPDFLEVVKKNFPVDSQLILGCQMGMRSQRAAEILATEGYQNLSNVKGGFGGVKNRSGITIEKGWEEMGLPVSHDNDDGVSYESLSAGE